VPGVHTLFREATDRHNRIIVRNCQQFRPIDVDDVTIVFDVTDFTVKGRCYSRIPYESGVTNLVQRVLRPGGTFIDVGANAGYYSVLAAARVGSAGRVLAFEPNPTVRERLQLHVALNRVTDRVSIFEVALGARDADAVEFFLSCVPENSGLSSLVPPSPDSDGVNATAFGRGLRHDVRIRVPVRTFDSWAERAGVTQADLVKIDVEGAELDVLCGMSRSLASGAFPRIICETAVDGPAQRLMEQSGYSTSVLDPVPGGTPNLLFSLPDQLRKLPPRPEPISQTETRPAVRCVEAECERASRASHATGASRRSGERESVWGSPRGEAPRMRPR